MVGKTDKDRMKTHGLKLIRREGKQDKGQEVTPHDIDEHEIITALNIECCHKPIDALLPMKHIYIQTTPIIPVASVRFLSHFKSTMSRKLTLLEIFQTTKTKK